MTVCTSVALGDRSSLSTIWAAVVTFSAVSASGWEVRIWVLLASDSKSAGLVSWGRKHLLLSHVLSADCKDTLLPNLIFLEGTLQHHLTFCCMSLSVWSHWRRCTLGSKLGDPLMVEHLVEASDLPAGQKWVETWHMDRKTLVCVGVPDGWVSAWQQGVDGSNYWCLDWCKLNVCENLPPLVPVGQTSSEYANQPMGVRGKLNPLSCCARQKFSKRTNLMN